jgi:hypothetical protein
MEELALCTFRNLAQASYREARHIGPPGDRDAKLGVAGSPYLAQARKCQRWRARLQGLGQYEASLGATSSAEVLDPYQRLTGLEPEDLVVLFRSEGWRRGYGGEKWAVIAEKMIELRGAIDAGDQQTALETCAEAETLRHNSGPLVPTLDEWSGSKWIRQKWPRLCR